MITKEEYQSAIASRDAAQKVINQFHKERLEVFDNRLKSGVPFTDEELVYSETLLCPCGYGLAYPKDCGPGHYWDCSAVMKGLAADLTQHTGKLPFAFYDIKAEGERYGSNLTTRGVFKPKTT